MPEAVRWAANCRAKKAGGIGRPLRKGRGLKEWCVDQLNRDYVIIKEEATCHSVNNSNEVGTSVQQWSLTVRQGSR